MATQIKQNSLMYFQTNKNLRNIQLKRFNQLGFCFYIIKYNFVEVNFYEPTKKILFL